MTGACPTNIIPIFFGGGLLAVNKVRRHSSNSCWSNASSSGFEMRLFLRRTSPTLAVWPSPTRCWYSRWMWGSHPFNPPIPPEFRSSWTSRMRSTASTDRCYSRSESIFLNCTSTVTHPTVNRHSSTSDNIPFCHRKDPNRVIRLARSCSVTPFNCCLHH